MDRWKPNKRIEKLMAIKANINTFYKWGTSMGGRCLQGNLWYSPPASMTSRLASVTFKMASKVFIEETDKNFDFTTEIQSVPISCIWRF